MKTIDLLLGTDVIDVGPRRRGGSNRLKNNLLCQDSYLLDALVKLDGNSSMPRSWSRCARHYVYAAFNASAIKRYFARGVDIYSGKKHLLFCCYL